MPAMHVRDVDDAVIAALKARAAKNRRSLQGEVRTILEQAVRDEGPPSARHKLALVTVHVGGKTSYSREDLYDEHDD